MRSPRDNTVITRRSSRICTKVNCIRCLKAFIAFLFSRVGLTMLMAAYIVLGGKLFEALELSNERNTRIQMHIVMNKTLNCLFNEALKMHVKRDFLENYSETASIIISDFENSLIQSIRNGYNGLDNFDDTEWSFFGAVLYATTLVSTIGYGHITCKTQTGKIATIIYSLFGIPLMMLFSTNIGSSMATSFRFIFLKALKNIQTGKRKKTSNFDVKTEIVKNIDKHPTVSQLRPKAKSTPLPMPPKTRQLETAKIPDYNNHRQQKTVIEALLVNDTQREQQASYAIEINRDQKALHRIDELIEISDPRILRSLPEQNEFYSNDLDMDTERRIDQLIKNSAVDMKYCSNYDNVHNHDNLATIGSVRSLLIDTTTHYGHSASRPRSKTQQINMFDDNIPFPLENAGHIITAMESNDDEDSQKQEEPIPILLAGLVLFLYMLGGALLFAGWEKEWSFLSSFYFCFVTLTTIGFGDFVPGKTITSSSPYKFIIATCYIVFGLVILAMCLDLVKERIIMFFKKCTNKVGF
ncbi:hypothetical protein GJ496_005555 [Pomphorhynchus laevis]|nr:hypothetical protein GJ496_005555 [Pomphorhynchus laevis]